MESYNEHEKTLIFNVAVFSTLSPRVPQTHITERIFCAENFINTTSQQSPTSSAFLKIKVCTAFLPEDILWLNSIHLSLLL